MKSYGVGMSSISNNIANINTLAFKNSMMLYSDNISKTVNSSSSNGITEMSQLGTGVNVNVNRTMHREGAFMQGSSPTDLAISGKGFFGVQQGGVTQYTRAGNFRFTEEGALIDPNGFSLLGYRLAGDGSVSGSVEPITLDFDTTSGQGYMQPKATTSVSTAENLGSRTTLTKDPSNQFFSLTSAWNGTQDPPLSEDQYSHKSSVTVYDSNGTAQKLNTYYDYVGSFNGKHVYQYVTAMDPSVDGSANAGTEAAGLLAAGTVTFSSDGDMEDMTMFTAPVGGDASDMSTWQAAGFDSAGNPAFAAAFAGTTGQMISMNLGLEMNGTWTRGYTDAASVNADPEALYTGSPRTPYANRTKSFSGSSGTVSSNQNGFAAGYLKELTVGKDGIMAGRYSNGETMDLFQIPVYRFINEEGLRHEGGNRYTATDDSGDAELGLAGTENYGSLHEATLEQSNVDLATEFATMIVTQRGFQMNSKVVTTSDQLLQKAVELKR